MIVSYYIKHPSKISRLHSPYSRTSKFDPLRMLVPVALPRSATGDDDAPAVSSCGFAFTCKLRNVFTPTMHTGKLYVIVCSQIHRNQFMCLWVSLTCCIMNTGIARWEIMDFYLLTNQSRNHCSGFQHAYHLSRRHNIVGLSGQ